MQLGQRTMLSKPPLSNLHRLVALLNLFNRQVHLQSMLPIRPRPSETISPLGRPTTLRRRRRKRWRKVRSTVHKVSRMLIKRDHIHSSNRIPANNSFNLDNRWHILISKAERELPAWDRFIVSKVYRFSKGTGNLSMGSDRRSVSNKIWVR